jgi:hypothetical protein
VSGRRSMNSPDCLRFSQAQWRGNTVSSVAEAMAIRLDALSLQRLLAPARSSQLRPSDTRGQVGRQGMQSSAPLPSPVSWGGWPGVSDKPVRSRRDRGEPFGRQTALVTLNNNLLLNLDPIAAATGASRWPADRAVTLNNNLLPISDCRPRKDHISHSYETPSSSLSSRRLERW